MVWNGTALNYDITYFNAQATTITDYYPFGQQIEERSWVAPSNKYRFGFNGQERDDEVSGAGNSYTAEYWQYDSRLGRRWNTDPVVVHYESGYAVFRNAPINLSDSKGDNPGDPIKGGVNIGLLIGTHNIGFTFQLEGAKDVGDWKFAGGFGFTGYHNFNNTQKGGLEFRFSGLGGYDDGKNGFSLGTNYFFGAGGMQEFNQQTGILNFRFGKFSASYENDGNPFAKGQTGWRRWPWLADGDDKFRSAAVTATLGDVSIGFKLLTGKRNNYHGDDRKVGSERTGKFGERMPNGFVNETGQAYRMGAAFISYAGVKLGIESDLYIRHGIQDIFAHHWLTKQPGFRSYSKSIKPFVEVNTMPLMSEVLGTPRPSTTFFSLYSN